MRYTTIIDIREITPIYSNHNARLVYLHLVLRSGYHDADRDLCGGSLRQLASEIGISLSALRHALALLERAQLVAKSGPMWQVRKWISEQPITARPKTKRAEQAAKNKEIAERDKAEQEERERAEKAERQRLRAGGKTGYQLYLENLQARAAAGDLEAVAMLARNNK